MKDKTRNRTTAIARRKEKAYFLHRFLNGIVRIMIYKVIKTEGDYQRALARIDELMDAEPNTPEGDELELLINLVELYEEKKYPIDMPDPVEAIKFRMEQLNLNQQALVPFVGSKSKVSEVLNKKRPLSLSMMRALHKGLGIPAEILLQEQGQDFQKKFRK